MQQCANAASTVLLLFLRLLSEKGGMFARYLLLRQPTYWGHIQLLAPFSFARWAMCRGELTGVSSIYDASANFRCVLHRQLHLG